MTNRYMGTIKCPYCNKDTEFLYADEWAETQICDNCKKKFKMRLKFVAEKLK